MCYCKTSGGDLAQSIADSGAKIPQVQSDIEESEAELVRIKQELISHQEDRSAAKAAMDAATAQREKEHESFAATSGEYKTYLDALDRAIPAIMKGMSGVGLLQATTGETLRKAVVSATTVTDYDRQMVMSFLGADAVVEDGYVPKGGEISGILKQIREDFQKSLDEVVGTEQDSVKVYEELMSAKTKQVDALGAAVEKKIARTGDLQVSIANMKNDLTESEAALVADQKLASEITSSCDSKAAEWQERLKTRGEELVAIHETIKILNDDDALELFKKTLPGASGSLIQTADAARRRAAEKALSLINHVHRTSGSHPELDFMVMALQGKKVDFSKVIKMIDDMAALLKQEQFDDDAKKEYCEKQIDQMEDKTKELTKKVEDLEVSIEEKAESIKEIIGELKSLAKSVEETDKMVAEATEDRKEANGEYKELMASNSAAKEVLGFAKNRLNKFYNPKMYQAPPKAEEEASLLQQGARSLAKVKQHGAGDEPQPPAPATWGGYEKKSGETNGVIAMIDTLIRDLDKEMTEAESEEKNGQKQYEETMNDAAKKRAADLKSIAGKEKAKADFEEGKATDEATKEVEGKELKATSMVVMQLHQECDWLVQNFELRKQARAEEGDALQQAKAILSGADFALVQSKGVAKNLRGL